METEIVETPIVATEEPIIKPLDLPTAVQRLLKSAIYAGKLYRGLREAAKLMDRGEASLVILAEDCDEPSYVKLVEALCKQRQVPLLHIEEKKDLGEWSGLCQFDKEGNARNVVGCSCVGIKEVGTDAEAYQYISDHMRKAAQ
ncbi:putative 40S ribosomal protein S12 [Blattamonas nauphoetae]|uniref:40S ribosomal protein S12 n=1 Tax=Blattamonas nauphoetae TaxID=2049346 RepID=A0ABQ9Y4F7_9EUKA|nr:putative 40S ribosomal protein S12 [Blattamonas nauphoetae]